MSETILVVDDEPAVLKVTAAMLREAECRVLEARRPEDAVAACGRRDESIDLLVTDVSMAGVSGGELADVLVALRPSMRVLFVSGSPSDDALRSRVASGGAAFLEKPYTPDTLVAKVREVLGSAPR